MAQEKMGTTANARNSGTVFMGQSCECLVMKHPGDLVFWSSGPLSSHLSAADVFLWQSCTITTSGGSVHMALCDREVDAKARDMSQHLGRM